MSENTSVTVCLCVFLLCITSAVISGCRGSEETTRVFIKNGYIQKQNIGSTRVVWVKENYE